MTAKAVVDLCKELGFARAAVLPIEAPRRHDLYTSWLTAGHAAEMAYLASPEHVRPRADLHSILDSAQSLVVVALAYDRNDPIPITALTGKIARYARGEDYHLVMRDRLVALADRIAQELGHAVATRPCVDSAPVLEREWAERGGLGFVAKNTMLIAPGIGSYVVLGELLVAAPLEIQTTEQKPRCGTCRSCLDACPTNAFVDAYVLDARRCISYLTIEFHGIVPRDLRPQIGTWIFGCDICQEVCPFNAGAGTTPEPLLSPRTHAHALPDLVELAFTNTNQLRQFTKRTALRRTPRQILRRNIAIALGNTADPRAIPALQHLLEDPHAIVRAHAVWGLAQLGAPIPETDPDPDVVAEITYASGTPATTRTPPPRGSGHP
ncbi:MAG: tRNA epoxyqueuosine(34) reductase QueG [Kofleriaceae bacterium]